MVAFTVVALCVAHRGPRADRCSRFGSSTPYKFHYNLITGFGSMPTGKFGGMSWSHWFGVEPQTGRDVMSRVDPGHRVLDDDRVVPRR